MTESQPFDEGREGEAMLVDVLVEIRKAWDVTCVEDVVANWI